MLIYTQFTTIEIAFIIKKYVLEEFSDGCEEFG